MTGYVILGLGLNVNWNPGEHDDVLYPATSILAESGSLTSRNELLSDILEILEKNLKDVLIFDKLSKHESVNYLGIEKMTLKDIHEYFKQVNGVKKTKKENIS